MDLPAFRSAELVGLLADPVRLRTVAAIVLGARTYAEVRAATGDELRAITRACNRLVDAGLVIDGGNGALFVVEGAFAAVARNEATSGPRAAEEFDAPAEEAKVLRAFVRDGRLTSIPTGDKKKIAVLEWLAPNFEPGRKYSEQMVNLVLGKFHADTAALRRYLVDFGYLSRENGQYWRSGGRVDP